MSGGRQGAVEVALPQGLSRERHLELRGHGWGAWARRAALVLLAALLVVGLFNVFGQKPVGSRAASGAAVLTVEAPTRARGGLLYTASFGVVARQRLKDARLLLGPGWIDGMQVNSTNPQPGSETSSDGRVVLDLGPIDQGHRALYFMEFQVNPTTVGSRSQDVQLYDGRRLLLRIDRTLTVFP